MLNSRFVKKVFATNSLTVFTKLIAFSVLLFTTVCYAQPTVLWPAADGAFTRISVDSTYYLTGDLKWAVVSRGQGQLAVLTRGDSVFYTYSIKENGVVDSVTFTTYKGVPLRVDSIINYNEPGVANYYASHKAMIADTVFVTFAKHKFGRKHPLAALNNTTVPVYRFVLKDCVGKLFYFTPVAGYAFTRLKLFRSNANSYITQFAGCDSKEYQELIYILYASLLKKKYRFYNWNRE